MICFLFGISQNKKMTLQKEEEVLARIGNPKYFRGSRKDAYDDYLFIRDRPHLQEWFMMVMKKRFHDLTHGFERDGKPVNAVAIMSVQNRNADESISFVLLVWCTKIVPFAQETTYHLTYREILLDCNAEWLFLERLHCNGPEVFVLGIHVRAGAQSSIRRATLSDLYERQVLGIIFKFTATPIIF